MQVESLSNAKEQLQVQAQQLLDAQQQVDELLQAQMRLKAMLISPPGVASSTGAPQPGDSAGDAAKASEARVLLGKAVRRQTEQQLQIEAMSASLRDERTRALIACQKASDTQRQAEQLQGQLATLREPVPSRIARSPARSMRWLSMRRFARSSAASVINPTRSSQYF